MTNTGYKKISCTLSQKERPWLIRLRWPMALLWRRPSQYTFYSPWSLPLLPHYSFMHLDFFYGQFLTQKGHATAASGHDSPLQQSSTISSKCWFTLLMFLSIHLKLYYCPQHCDFYHQTRKNTTMAELPPSAVHFPVDTSIKIQASLIVTFSLPL